MTFFVKDSFDISSASFAYKLDESPKYEIPFPMYKFSQPFESTKINNIFKLEVSFVLLFLVSPLSWQVDGIVSQTNILSDPPFHVDHGDAIY